MSNAAELLDQAAYAIAEEIRDGKWNHIRDGSWGPIIDELRKRVPGFTTEEYQKAIGQGMFDSR